MKIPVESEDPLEVERGENVAVEHGGGETGDVPTREHNREGNHADESSKAKQNTQHTHSTL